MANLLMLTCTLCALALAVAGAGSPAASPPPSTDCMGLLLGMSDCLTYLQNGSTDAKPDNGCCSGFKTVLKVSPACLCDAFKNSNDYGISLNITRAMGLPAACGVSSNALNQCTAPSPAPANAPKPPHNHSSPVPAPAPILVTPPPPVSPVAPATPPSKSSPPPVSPVAPVIPASSSPSPAPSESGSSESARIFSVMSLFLATLAVAII